MKRYLVSIIIAAAFLTIVACSPMKTMWRDTLTQGTQQAYESFLQQYPESEYSVEASLALCFYQELDSVTSIEAAEALIKDYQSEPFCYRAIPKLEDLLILDIKSQGAGNRLVIKELMPTGNEALTGVTFSEGKTPGTCSVSTEFPGDMIMLTGGSAFNTRVHRYRGSVPVGGALQGYTFVGKGDKLHLLTFAQVRGVGYVYLRGKGLVNTPGGEKFSFDE